VSRRVNVAGKGLSREKVNASPFQGYFPRDLFLDVRDGPSEPVLVLQEDKERSKAIKYSRGTNAKESTNTNSRNLSSEKTQIPPLIKKIFLKWGAGEKKVQRSFAWNRNLFSSKITLMQRGGLRRETKKIRGLGFTFEV